MRMTLGIVATISFTFAACNTATPEKAAPPPAATEPRQAAPTPSLMSGIGSHDHAIATANADAQRYFVTAQGSANTYSRPWMLSGANRSALPM
jgi:hypothetical protein